MWASLTDFTLLLHAIFLIFLGILIFRTARSKHDRLFWLHWPPLLLTAWGTSELADGLVYLRRWMSRTTGWDLVHYEGAFSFVLNSISLVAIVLMVYLILHGDMSGDTRKVSRKHRTPGGPTV